MRKCYSVILPPLQALTAPRPLSPPSFPNSQANPTFYISPHSPMNLRFPPSTCYPEWHRRCFRCCRCGHTKAMCCNSLKCGKCWREGHVDNHCKTLVLNPATQPFRPTPKPAQHLLTRGEPSFDELLLGTNPSALPVMLEGRPTKVHCYIPREMCTSGN